MMFLQLSINNEYKYGMGGVDIAGQLQNYYHFDQWHQRQCNEPCLAYNNLIVTSKEVA